MEAGEILKILKDKIHTTVIATMNEDNKPETRVIDIMISDNDGLYFITAKGKRFYEQLISTKYVSISGFYGQTTLSSVAISINGAVTEMSEKYVDRVFKENPYMNDIYPTTDSRIALVVFKVYKGCGEYFDLSKKPIERLSFSFGGDDLKSHGYYINDNCILCKRCTQVCPQNCIEVKGKIAVIRQENCLHCGNCKSVCPIDCVERS